MMQIATHTSDSAKRFLLSKVMEQAECDGVALSDVERRMFIFSETSGGVPDLEASEKFDVEYDSEEFEAKITKLLKRAYTRDKRTADGKKSWREALNALRDEDFYGMVMVDQAGIPGAHPNWGLVALQSAPFAIVELVVVAIGWVVVFQPFRLHLAIPDWLRLLLLPVFIGLFWLVGRVFQDLEWAKLRKPAVRKPS